MLTQTVRFAPKIIKSGLSVIAGFAALKRNPLKLVFSSLIMWVSMLLSLWFCMKTVKLDVGLVHSVLLVFAAAMGLLLPTAPGVVEIIQIACLTAMVTLFGKKVDVFG